MYFEIYSESVMNEKVNKLFEIATLTYTHGPSFPTLFQLSPLFLPLLLCSPKDPVNTCSLLSGALWCCKYLSRLHPIAPLRSCESQPVYLYLALLDLFFIPRSLDPCIPTGTCAFPHCSLEVARALYYALEQVG